MFRLIDELEQLVENGKGHFFGKVFINEEEFFQQTTRLKKALPDDLKKAERVAQNEQRMMSGAQTEAQRLVSEAQNDAQRLVGDARSQADRAIQDSRAHAERIIEDARREAERIIADAQQHAEQMVSEDTITQNAQQFAQAHQQQAVRDADQMRTQADEYAYDLLEKVESVLQKLSTSVEQGKEHLRQSQS